MSESRLSDQKIILKVTYDSSTLPQVTSFMTNSLSSPCLRTSRNSEVLVLRSPPSNDWYGSTNIEDSSSSSSLKRWLSLMTLPISPTSPYSLRPPAWATTSWNSCTPLWVLGHTSSQWLLQMPWTWCLASLRGRACGVSLQMQWTTPFLRLMTVRLKGEYSWPSAATFAIYLQTISSRQGMPPSGTKPVLRKLSTSCPLDLSSRFSCIQQLVSTTSRPVTRLKPSHEPLETMSRPAQMLGSSQKRCSATVSLCVHSSRLKLNMSSREGAVSGQMQKKVMHILILGQL